MDSNEYEVTDSEDEYSKEEKILLEDARRLMRKKEASSDEEVYGFDQSDSNEDEDSDNADNDEEDEDEEGMDMGSDLEDEKILADERAWGKKKKSFYDTDFVDQDYEGIYQGKEAEIAELEEQEAKNIQKRIVEQLDNSDFFVSDIFDIAEATEATVNQKEVIKSDLSKLTKRQQLDLVKKESPEFFALVEDFKLKLTEAHEFMPVIEYFKKIVKKSFPALDFLQTKLTIILNYCTNISFYLFLKAKRIPIKNHPVLKSLFQYRQLLQELEDPYQTIIKPQLKEILKSIEAGEEIALDEELVEMKTLKVLSKKQKTKEMNEVQKTLETEKESQDEEIEMEEEPSSDESETERQIENDDGKRAITYEMARNKGLTPKRKKEQRNPRVKHRRKYEKAKIRRKGQVRIPRREIPVYGGEMSGIKFHVKKGIKLK